MKNLKIYKNEEEDIHFILNQFVITHENEDSIYEKEIILFRFTAYYNVTLNVCICIESN